MHFSFPQRLPGVGDIGDLRTFRLMMLQFELSADGHYHIKCDSGIFLVTLGVKHHALWKY